MGSQLRYPDWYPTRESTPRMITGDLKSKVDKLWTTF